MKYEGYVVTAVVAFLTGWMVRAARATSNSVEVTVSLKTANGILIKDVYPRQLAVNTGDKIIWTIYNGTGRSVVVSLVEITADGLTYPQGKMPLLGNLTTKAIPDGDLDTIKATVRPNAMLSEPPPAHPKDEFKRRYQDFTYKFQVGNDTIDPEIRIREC